MNNEYLKFYDTHKISPVKQNIEDFDFHVKRRINLLRHLSIHPFCIKDKMVLEVGPGGGFNSLAINALEPKLLTLVEPNKTGFNELEENLRKYSMNDNIDLYNMRLEDFILKDKNKYDVVFCEGLIQGLENKENFITLLSSKVSMNGILVITTADEISIFFEMVKRFIANQMVKEIKDFDEKIIILKDIFKKDLDSLVHMTRKHEDWCADLLCDAYYNHNISINDVLSLLGDKFYLLGSSPDIFQDFRWFKSLPKNCKEYNHYFLKQFKEMRHCFIDYRLSISKRKIQDNLELSNLCKNFINIVKSLDNNIEKHWHQTDIINIVINLEHNLRDISVELSNSLKELIILLNKVEIKFEDIEKLEYLPLCFGKGQIFLSFSRV